MADEGAVVHLPAGDAIALLRLLEGYGAVLREGELAQHLATGGVDVEAGGGAPWREQVTAQVAAACGLLRQSLEGFDTSAVLARGPAWLGEPGTAPGRG